MLLISVAGLFVFSHLYRDIHPVLPWLLAFAEAGLVGGLADWFAVTAIFKHPLGIPLAHTAILRKERERIVETIAEFIAKDVFTEEAIRLLVERFEPSAKLLGLVRAQWSESGEGLMRRSDHLLFSALGIKEEEFRVRVRETLQDRVNVSSALVVVLTSFLESPDWQNRLQPFAHTLKKHLPAVASIFEEEKIDYSQEDSRFFSRVKQVAVKMSSNAALEKAKRELDVAAKDPEHRLWVVLRTELERFVEELREEGELYDRVNLYAKKWIGSSEMLDQFFDATKDLFLNSGSSVQEYLDGAIEDKGLQRTLDEKLIASSPFIITSMQGGLEGGVKAIVGSWEPDHWIKKLESAVGNDLQFIRINGTLIGGFIGLLLHLFKQFI